MEVGGFFLAWAAVPLVLSMAGYFLVAVGVGEFRLSARVIYWFLIGMVAVAFANLFYLFVSDQFQFSYVASYSSRDLSNTWPHFFKMSALWGGQQGTFLMWLVFGLVLGVWVKSKARGNEGWVMFFYILGQTFLLVLAIVSNPFEKLNFIPTDGQGLNPLLQNYWMQIHPPIVFAGFASACIPFAFAMAALAANKYDNWVRQTMPWVIFTVVTLGFGIFLGGYWAYETLGWGGYWAWDPVENSSLIPWLFGIALLHGMVVEKSRGTWRRTNLFLAITLFLMIIYGTFLTRSGVLADFSVHSFVDLGYNNLLWASIVVMGLLSYGLWAYRAYRMKVASSAGTEILSQEFSTFLAMVLLLPFTMLVLFWTSFPLVTTLMSKLPLLSRISPAPAAIGPGNYNMVGLVFAFIFCSILGFNALLGWKTTDREILKKKLLLPLATSFVAALLFVIPGFSKIARFWSGGEAAVVNPKVIIMTVLYFLIFFTAVFSLMTNLLFLVRRWRVSFPSSGGYITHLGFSFLLMGIIVSSSFGDSRKLTVPEGSKRSALGYDITFTSTARTAPKEERAYFELTRGDRTIYAYSTSKEVRRGQQIQYARTPHIKKFLTHDLYLSLENLADPNPGQMRPFELHPGESKDILGYTVIFDRFQSDGQIRQLAGAQPTLFQVGKNQSFTIDDMIITFDDFDMSEHQESMTGGIGARLKIEHHGQIETLTPFYRPSQETGPAFEPLRLPSGSYISLVGIRADIGSVVLACTKDRDAPDIDVGVVVRIVSGADTTTVTPVYNPSEMNPDKFGATLHDGSSLVLLDVQAANNLAHFILDPAKSPILASIEISTKPLINLVWVGFLMMVAGAIVAVFRRMSEAGNKR